MSDTPRTDARLRDVLVTCDDSCVDVYTQYEGEECEIVTADFARTLEREVTKLVRAAVKAFTELNEIRARDGVPYTHQGCKSSVCENYFSSVVDELDAAVKAATGLSAHCHPELYRKEKTK